MWTKMSPAAQQETLRDVLEKDISSCRNSRWERPTISRSRLKKVQLWSQIFCAKGRIILLPKSRVIRYNSPMQPFERFPLGRAGNRLQDAI